MVRQMTINASRCPVGRGKEHGQQAQGSGQGEGHGIAALAAVPMLAPPCGLLAPWEMGSGRAPTSFPSQAQTLYLALRLLLLPGWGNLMRPKICLEHMQTFTSSLSHKYKTLPPYFRASRASPFPNMMIYLSIGVGWDVGDHPVLSSPFTEDTVKATI